MKILFSQDYINSMVNCINIAASRLGNLMKIFDAIEQEGDISATIITGAVVTHFTARDFENDYYRMLFLYWSSIHLAMIAQQNK